MWRYNDFPWPIAAEVSSLCEVSRAQESDYGSANAAGGAYPYPPFVPFILHPDIDVTREVIRFPEEADECVDLSYLSRAHFILSNPQSYDPGVRAASISYNKFSTLSWSTLCNALLSAETVALHSSPEFQSSCSESASSRPPAHHEGLLDPLGLLSDAELLGVLMNC